MKKEKILWLAIVLVTSALLVVLAWRVPGFSDGYVRHIFPIFVETYGRLTGLAPVSVGEIMIVAALFYLALTLIMLIIRFTLAVNGHELFKKFTKYNMRFLFNLVVIVIFVQVLNCFVAYKCSGIYEEKGEIEWKAIGKKSTSEEKAGAKEELADGAESVAGENSAAGGALAARSEAATDGGTVEELFLLRDKLVNQANIIAENFERDSRGYIVTDWLEKRGKASGVVDSNNTKLKRDETERNGDGTRVDGTTSSEVEGSAGSSRADNSKSGSAVSLTSGVLSPEKLDVIEADAVKAMKKLGKDAKERVDNGTGDALDESLSRLVGYFPNPKPMFFSKFMSQQSMAGWYFPFSLEANYNTMMYVTELPQTMCHELAHLKGFMLEDEASFISYVACMNSDDMLFEYSALLMAIGYINDEAVLLLNEKPERAELVKVERSNLVKKDMIFLTPEAWDEVEENAILKTEDVTKATDAFLNTNLELNGVEDGVRSYGRVVNLIMRYEKSKGPLGRGE